MNNSIVGLILLMALVGCGSDAGSPAARGLGGGASAAGSGPGSTSGSGPGPSASGNDAVGDSGGRAPDATGGAATGGLTGSSGGNNGGSPGSAGAAGGPPKDPFEVVTAGKAVDIYVDSADLPAVVRAVGDLRDDVKRVSGASPLIKNTTTGLSETAIIVGTLGKSPVIDRLVSDGKLDVKGVTGAWEAFTMQAVSEPVAGVKRALVIAGSDRRGSVFGIYDLSERMGVSPWYWWADVTPTVSTTVTVEGAASIHGEPSVRYRGIFINDEENFAGWAAAKLDSGKKVGPETYKRVFELLLRLKANFIWPAMHDVSDEFNKYPENAKNADLYGIVMGSSHPEMLLRNNVKEWAPWAKAHPSGGQTPVYDYSVNPQVIYDYWDARVQTNGQYENGYSIGMRGEHDSGLVAQNAPTTADKVKLMETIFADQRKILSTRVKTDLTDVLQLFTPYKEVLPIYNAGLKVPDDAMILWTEDNHGYVRQLPNDAERKRSGGHGIYYHFSYWGAPTSYLWLNSTPLPLTYEEMRKSYDAGAKRLWIVNVGDIKPAEHGTEFFLRLAYRVDDWNESSVSSFLKGAAARDFGAAAATEAADILSRLFQLNIARRPEFMAKTVFDLVSYGDEAQQRLDELSSLLQRATALSDMLPAEKRDAFYELVLYPVRASFYQNQKYIAAAKADLYAQQGRTAAVTKYRTLATTAYNTVRDDLTYFNNTLAQGKWKGIINPYNTAQPTIEALPAMASAPAASGQALGVVYEGQTTGNESLKLSFSTYTQDTRFIDVFTKGSSGFDWTATASAAWVKLSKASGSLTDEQRIQVSIDWASVPAGNSAASVTITAGGASKMVPIEVSNPATPSRTELQGFVEANGYVALEAEHFTSKVDRGDSHWAVFAQLGRAGDAVKVLPDISPSITADYANASAELDYKIYFFTTGTFPVTVYRIPTLNTNGNCRLAVALDDASATQLRGANSSESAAWSKNVTEQIEKLATTIQVKTAGYHTLKLLKVDPSMVIDRIVVDTGDLRPSYLGPPESYHH